MPDVEFGLVSPELVTRVVKSVAGEGSRGGHIIGHTKSGKPIYKTEGNVSAGGVIGKDTRGFPIFSHTSSGKEHEDPSGGKYQSFGDDREGHAQNHAHAKKHFAGWTDSDHMDAFTHHDDMANMLHNEGNHEEAGRHEVAAAFHGKEAFNSKRGKWRNPLAKALAIQAACAAIVAKSVSMPAPAAPHVAPPKSQLQWKESTGSHNYSGIEHDAGHGTYYSAPYQKKSGATKYSMSYQPKGGGYKRSIGESRTQDGAIGLAVKHHTGISG